MVSAMSDEEAPINLWLPVVTEQFPELGHVPETWSLIDLSATFGKLLEQGARRGDREMMRRVLCFVLWLEAQSKDEESLVYACQDILRWTIRSPALREAFASVLNGRGLAQLSGCIEYLSSKDVLSEMAEMVRARKRVA